MIVSDQRVATRFSTILTTALFLSLGTAAFADPGSAPVAGDDAGSPTVSLDVTLQSNGAESSFSTQARTVGELLAERGVSVTAGDFVSPSTDSDLSAGSRVVYRRAEPIQLHVGSSIRAFRSAAPTVGDLLRDERIVVGPRDEISPGRAQRLTSNEIIRVIRVKSWTARERVAIAPNLERRTDRSLLPGTMKTLAGGRSGIREATVRYTRRDDAPPTRTVLATRVIRAPQARIVARGGTAYAAFARVAAQGFASAIHLAGSALHMVATAYTAACYGCTGITASGVRAGFGVIAVDPSVIPLGTKVFIPGYGRAVAGDTGGAILGHRVDLGFDSTSAALRFGRRPVTLYVLR